LIHYQIIDGQLYRTEKCNFPMRCEGIEYFLLAILKNQSLPNMEFVLNVADYPQSYRPLGGLALPIFSFSKDSHYDDIMYPAWAFWKGGPCTSTEKNCLGRWDLKRNDMPKASPTWENKQPLAFFRGSRTSHERDPLIKLSLAHPDLVEAKYTKNQAWRSLADTMGMDPAPEVPLGDHCQYKYLFNFRGVAASFRHRHLFLCQSLILHVGEEWLEFYYLAMKPWVHYVPIKTTFTDALEHLQFVKENDDIARQIAKAGYDFIMAHLRMEDVQYYWYSLLRDYANLQRWTVTKSPTTHLVQST